MASDDERESVSATLRMPRKRTSRAAIVPAHWMSLESPVIDLAQDAGGQRPADNIRRSAHLMLSARKYMARGFWVPASLATLAICLSRIGRPALWRDEMATWWAATLPIDDFVHLVANVDVVNGPYYLFMRGWIAVAGDSATAMRLPSALALAATAAITALLGRRLYDATAGLIGGMFFAAVPAVSLYGHEARAYGLVMFAVTLATLLLVRALDKPTWGRFSLYGTAVSLVGLTHLVALVIVVGHFVGVLCWSPRLRPTLLRWLGVAAFALLPLVPLAVVGYGQRDKQLYWLTQPSLSVVEGTPEALFFSLPAAMIVIALAVAAWRPDSTGWLLGGWCLVAPFTLFLASHLTPVYLPRYLTYLIPGLCLLAAATVRGVPAVRPGWVPLVTGAIITVLILTVSIDQHRRIHQVDFKQDFDYAAVFAPIRDGYQQGDAITFAYTEWDSMLTQGAAYELRAGPRPREAFAAVSAERAGWWTSTVCADIAACRTDAPRVWLVRHHSGPDPIAGMAPQVEAVLRADYTIADIKRPNGLTVALLIRR